MEEKELWPPTTVTTTLVYLSIGAVGALLAAAMSYVFTVLIDQQTNLPTPVLSLFMAAGLFVCISLVLLRKRLVIYVLIFMCAGVVIEGIFLSHNLRFTSLIWLGFLVWDVIKLTRKGELV